MYKDSTGLCAWRVRLPATTADAKTTYNITITSNKYGKTGISDVMFGDVWICSGQSNMEFSVSQVLLSNNYSNYHQVIQNMNFYFF